MVATAPEDELETLRKAGLEPREDVPGLFLLRNGGGAPILPADPIKLTGRAQKVADAMRDELATRLREKGKDLPTIGRKEGANLMGADLMKTTGEERADLMGAWLQDANLHGAQLQGANLCKAQLQGANLYKAQLQGTDLYKAQMQGAKLHEAQLQGGYLHEAQMQRAELYKAQLQGADICKAQLTEANLNKAQLTEANLSEAHLQGANFQAAQLEGANISEVTNMQGASFVGAKLVGANLANSKLTGADFTSADLTKANLNQALKSMRSYPRPSAQDVEPADFKALLNTATMYEVRSGCFEGNFDMLKMAWKHSRIGLTTDEKQLVYLSEELKKLKDKESTAANWRDAVQGWISVLELRGQLGVKCGHAVLDCMVADDKVLAALGSAEALMQIEGDPPAALITMIAQGPSAHIRKHGYRYTKRLDKELVLIQRIKELKMLASTGICIPLAVGTWFAVFSYFSGAMYDGASEGFGSQPTMVWVLPFLFVAGLLVLCCCVNILCRRSACISPI